MGTLKQFGFFALLIAALVPLNAQASIAADIAGGVAADQVIANALADGLTLNEIADQIAQEVGSANVRPFWGALVRTLSAATDTAPSAEGAQEILERVNDAFRAALAQNHAGRPAGQSYAMSTANFTPVDTSVIRGTTGVLTLSLVAPPTSPVGAIPVRMVGGSSGQTAPVGGGGGGGGGGRALLDAACEALGSQPGCVN